MTWTSLMSHVCWETAWRWKQEWKTFVFAGSDQVWEQHWRYQRVFGSVPGLRPAGSSSLSFSLLLHTILFCLLSHEPPGLWLLLLVWSLLSAACAAVLSYLIGWVSVYHELKQVQVCVKESQSQWQEAYINIELFNFQRESADFNYLTFNSFNTERRVEVSTTQNQQNTVIF